MKVSYCFCFFNIELYFFISNLKKKNCNGQIEQSNLTSSISTRKLRRRAQKPTGNPTEDLLNNLQRSEIPLSYQAYKKRLPSK